MKEQMHKRIATERAQAYAPKPKDNAAVAALSGAALAALAIVLFSRFYGIDIVRYWMVEVLLVLGSAVAGFVWYRLRRREHFAARAHEMEKIRDASLEKERL
jgi:uncharacterized membrane protein YqjE